MANIINEDNIFDNESNIIVEQYGVPMKVIEELKKIFKMHHPNQFVNQIAQIMKVDYPEYSFDKDDKYNYKCVCTFSGKFVAEGYNNLKKQAESKCIYFYIFFI